MITSHATYHQGSHVAVHSVIQPCYHCGWSNHTPNNCHFKVAICHACKKKGHLANVCRLKGQFQDRQRPEGEITKKQHRRKYAIAKWVQAESEESSGTSDPKLSMYKVEHSSAHPITVERR